MILIPKNWGLRLRSLLINSDLVQDHLVILQCLLWLFSWEHFRSLLLTASLVFYPWCNISCDLWVSFNSLNAWSSFILISLHRWGVHWRCDFLEKLSLDGLGCVSSISSWNIASAWARSKLIVIVPLRSFPLLNLHDQLLIWSFKWAIFGVLHRKVYDYLVNVFNIVKSTCGMNGGRIKLRLEHSKIRPNGVLTSQERLILFALVQSDFLFFWEWLSRSLFRWLHVRWRVRDVKIWSLDLSLAI